jgi:transcriptional regulator with XRE-family HTH domain
MNKFAERLKELRIENGLSQDELAIKTQISQSSISLYELGKRTPTIDIAIILCNFFKVSADYLIGLTD